MNNETRYVVRRADGKYLAIASTIDGRRIAKWTEERALATPWPFMTGATLAKGLDLELAAHEKIPPIPPEFKNAVSRLLRVNHNRRLK